MDYQNHLRSECRMEKVREQQVLRDHAFWQPRAQRPTFQRPNCDRYRQFLDQATWQGREHF